jgi:hypothetical protein
VSSPIVRRLLGAPPTRGCSREERLRYVRRCAVLPLPFTALLWIVVLGFGHEPAWMLIVIGAATALGIETVANLSWRIRRARTSIQGTDGSADPN